MKKQNAGKKMLSVMAMTAIIGSGVTAGINSPLAAPKAHASENEATPEKPATPVLSTIITNETTEIKGSAVPGAQILVQNNKYQNIATTTNVFADANGNFTVTMPKQEVGSVVLVFAKNTTTNQISISNYSSVKDVQILARDTVNQLFENNDPTGKIKASTDVVTIDTAQERVNAMTDATLKATAQSDLNQAKAQLAAQTALIAMFIDGDVTGTITEELTKEALTAAQAMIDTVSSAVVNTELQAILDEAQAQWDAKNVIVKPDTPAVATVITNETTEIKGKAAPGMLILVQNEKYQNIATQSNVMADENGDFTISISKQAVDNKVLVFARNTKTGQISISNFSVVKDVGQFIGRVTPNGYILGIDRYITGTFTGNVAYAVVTVDGNTYKGGTFNEDGTFKFYAIDKIKSTEHPVTMQVFDKSGKLLDTKTVTVQK